MKIKVLNIRLAKEFFEEDQEKVNQFLKTVKMHKSSTQLIEDKVNYWSILFYYTEKESEEKTNIQIENTTKVNQADLSSEQMEIYLALKEWRNAIASEQKLPAFTIFHNQTLINIAHAKIDKIEDLSGVKGIGQAKLSKYGSDIIALLNAL